MNFLFLLLPNLYDIFTVLMILYAFLLHHKGELQIPFGIACLLIYLATRLGIFAGKIIHKIIGRPQVEASQDQEDGVAAPNFFFDFGPQIVCVVAFQVIMMITSLPHAAAPAQTDNVASQDKQQIESVKSNLDADAKNATAEEAKSDMDELLVPDEEDIKPTAEEKPQASSKAQTTAPAVKPVVRIVKNTSSSKPVEKAVVEVKTVTEQPVIRYEIPETTLGIAGITPAERDLSHAQKSSTVSSATGASSGAVQQNVSSVVKSYDSSLKTKRYPGDDNPIPTTWGYYKQTSQEQQNAQQKNTTAAPASKSQTTSGYTIPANTMRAIGN